MATMSRPMNASHQKLAEKLLVLNIRGNGMVTRLYQIKKACASQASKPPFLSDKSLEPAIKYIQRKFPNVDVKGGGSQMNSINAIKSDILKTLQLYYFTFVDILDFKDHVSELLTTFDTCQIELDITTCFDITKNYLELINNYCTILILLSMVDDRKAVLGLYNVAYEMLHNTHEASFPRLSHMIAEYEQPLKKLCDDFVVHGRCLMSALASLVHIYPRRNLPAEQWRTHQLLSLTSSASHLANPAKTDVTPCEYLSVEQMQRWIIYCCTLMNNNLSEHHECYGLWLEALHDGWIMRLHRDEVLHVHNFLQQYFELLGKGNNKRISEVKDALAHATQFAPAIHRERRKYLRTALRELCLILTDQPGLLGPKALFIVMGMSLARDEVLWLMRHAHYAKMTMMLGSQAANGSKTLQKQQQQQAALSFDDDLVDRYLPELLFRLEEMRALIVRHSSPIIIPYHVAFLSGFDVQYLETLMQTDLTTLPEEPSVLLTSFINMLSDLPAIPQGVHRSGTLLFRRDVVSDATNINSNNSNPNLIPDLRALRLDWMRLQAMSSNSSSSSAGGGANKAARIFSIHEHKQFAYHLNCIMFHSRLVDDLTLLTTEVSDLSDYCFYPVLLEEQFQLCLEFPAQTRNIIAFPLICAHFLNAYHELCPEERKHIGDRSLQYVNHFLEEMAKEAKSIITTVCDEECVMRDSLLPKHAALQLLHNMDLSRQQIITKNVGPNTTITSSMMTTKKRRNLNAAALNGGASTLPVPGHESYRRTREELTTMDKLHMALTELAYSINYCNTIAIAQHVFSPREYLSQSLEQRFRTTLVGMAVLNAETHAVAKPTELLSSIRAYLSVLQTIERYVSLDMTRIFNVVLLQQTHPQDTHGDQTLTHLYTTWYLDNLLRRATAGQIAYSPRKQSFVSMMPLGAAAAAAMQSNLSLMPAGAAAAATAAQAAAAAAALSTLGGGAGVLKAEDYSSLMELCALAEILGPYGMKHLSENLAWNVASHLVEIKRVVLENREVLGKLRTRFENADEVRDLMRRVVGADDLIRRLIFIGILLCFRRLCQEALNQVLEKRTPFLMFCLKNFNQNRPPATAANGDVQQANLNNPRAAAAAGGNSTLIVNEMLASAGFETPVDSTLLAALRMHKIEGTEDDHSVSCLLLTFLAFFIGRIVKLDPTAYFDANLEAFSNNVHCLSEVLAVMFPSLFFLCGRHDIDDRMREFLALSSSTILRHNIVDVGGSGDTAGLVPGSVGTSGSGSGMPVLPISSTANNNAVTLAAKKDAYILLGILVAETNLTQDLIECCFPYDLLRTTYQIVLSASANAATVNR